MVRRQKRARLTGLGAHRIRLCSRSASMIARLFRPALDSASLTLLRRRRRASLSSPPAVRKNDSAVLFVYVNGVLYSNPVHSICRAHAVRRAQLQAQRVAYLAASPPPGNSPALQATDFFKGNPSLPAAPGLLHIVSSARPCIGGSRKLPATSTAEASLYKYGSLDRCGAASGQGLEVTPHHGRRVCGRRTGRIYGRRQASRTGQVSSSFRYAGENFDH